MVENTSATTYSPDGETEYAPIYELPGDDAADDVTVWLEPVDDDADAEKIGVELATFRAEWDECDYHFYAAQGDDTAAQYRDARRQRNVEAAYREGAQ